LGGMGARQGPAVRFTRSPQLPPAPKTFDQIFPSLGTTACEITRCQDSAYNCVAWTMADDTQWWEPIGRPRRDPFTGALVYWPGGVPTSGHTLGPAAWVSVYLSRGYRACGSADLERGTEKIAIYTSPDGLFTHVAWQAPDGWWWSKLGKEWAIRHERLEALENPDEYGTATIFLGRPRRSHRHCASTDDDWQKEA
jgi:hypothetical protein